MFEGHPGLAKEHAVPNRSENPVGNGGNNDGWVVGSHEKSFLLCERRKKEEGAATDRRAESVAGEVGSQAT